MKRQDINPDKIRSILVEIPVSGVAGSKDFSLGTVEQLRDAVGIISVEAFNTTLMTKGPTGNVNAPDAIYKVTTLTLSDKSNTEVRSRMPLSKIIRSNGNSAIEKINLFSSKGGTVLDPQRSGINVGDLSLLGAGTVVILEFTYVNA